MTQRHTMNDLPKVRRLVALPVSPGMSGVLKVASALGPALSGTGPAIAPIPSAPAALVEKIIDAIRPDDELFPLESPDIAIVCATSGSTGNPRAVLLSQDALLASANSFGARYGTDARWVVAMPVHRIAGLMVLVRSWVHGNPFEIDPSVGGARPFSAAAFAATTQLAVRASATDGLPLMVSLVPTQIARLLEAGSVGIEALKAYSVVLSGAAATPQPMLDALRSHGIGVVVSYGMSETCGGCVFDGLALSGVNISLSTKEATDPGRISVSGSVLASGYRLRPDLDAVSFIDGALQTHDVGRLDQAGLLHVLGRLDDVIMVGGVSVALGAVESVIRHHPDISDVAVVDVVDDLWGALPIAYIVTSKTQVDQMKLSEEVKSAVAQQIGRAATPRSIAFVNQLPMLDSGKVDRLSLRLQAASDIAQGRLEHPGLAQ